MRNAEHLSAATHQHAERRQVAPGVPKPNRINSTNVNGSQNPSHDVSTATSRVRLRSCNQDHNDSMMSAFDGGFNPSLQQLHEIVVLAFRSPAFFAVVR